MTEIQKDEMEKHWLVRKDTIRKLWIGGGVILLLTVLAQFFVPIKGKFGVDGWFAFPALYGFATCVAMVLGAKWLGYIVKRKEDYYDE
ncbi:hypothetical protein [Emcibacter sp.]|uniref:hypothetical protein n=1 Tax=Emcibacter sp. TaxID=1979954 RepID=UPI002AA6BCE8|nr:hypothetical protein [Emcibacter sp.]